MKRKADRRKRIQIKLFIVLILLLLLVVYSFIFIERMIKPTVSALAEVKVNSVVSELVNNSVREKFAEDVDLESLIIIERDGNGNITLVEANSIMMNRIASDLAYLIEQNFDYLGPTEVQISIGSLLGSQLLSQTGPLVDIQIVPVGMTTVNFKTEFTSTGINQTRYTVYLEVTTEAMVIVPFTSNRIIVNNTVPVADVIIVGDVPDSYIIIPEDNVPDIL